MPTTDDDQLTLPEDGLTWPYASGEMANRIRMNDWAATPLGPIETWPQSLRNAADTLLGAPFASVLLWGPELIIAAYNAEYRTILNDKPEALGRPVLEVWDEERDLLAPQLARVLAGETLAFKELPMSLKRGFETDESIFDYGYGPVRDESGKVAGVVVTIGEITHWMGAIRDARKNETRYRELFEAIDSGFCVIEMIFDTDGRATDYRFVEANPAFERQSGLIDAIGRRIGELAPNLEDHWFERYGRVALTGEPMRVEGEASQLGRWYDINAFRVGEPEQRRVGVLFTDISARREADKALRESEERKSFLLKLSDALQSLADPDAIQYEACRLLAERLGVGRVFYMEVDESADMARVVRDFTRDGAPSLAGTHRVADLRWSIAKLCRGETYAIADTQSSALVPAAERPASAALQIIAVMAVPLIKNKLLVGALGVTAGRPREWLAAEVELAREVSERIWAAAEQARAQVARRESEERLTQFGDNSPDTLWIIDVTTGRLTYLSAAYEHMWGEPRERVMDDLARWQEHVHPDDRSLVAKGMPTLLAGKRHSIEYRIIRPDGEIRWILDTGFPMMDDAGRVTSVAGVAQDLTARRRANAKVRESEQRFRLLLEGIPQLVWRAVDHGHWSWASPQWTVFTGQSANDSCGWGWLDMVHPDDRDNARQAWTRSVLTDKFAVEYRIRMIADERYRWFSTRATPVRNEAGELVEWLGTSTDIDDLRRLQKHQQVLLGELQHRVRNSLAVVRSIARRTAETSETVEEFSLHLEGRLDSFARTQTAVTRDPTGGIDLQTIAVDELLAHAAWEGKHTQVEGPQIKLHPKAGETLALAFHELASNAVQHGALSVSQGIVRLSWHVASGYDGKDQLIIVWDEDRPGEALTPPKRRGFGTELLENTLSYELEADTLLEFRSTGLHCVIIIPLTDDFGWKV